MLLFDVCCAQQKGVVQVLLGYGDGDVFGMSCLSVCGPSSDKKAMRQIITLQRTGQPGGAKILCYKRDGTPFWSALQPVCVILTRMMSVLPSSQLPTCMHSLWKSQGCHRTAALMYMLMYIVLTLGAREQPALTTCAPGNDSGVSILQSTLQLNQGQTAAAVCHTSSLI